MSGFTGWLESMSRCSGLLDLYVTLIKFVRREALETLTSAEFRSGSSYGSVDIDEKFKELLKALRKADADMYNRISNGFNKNWDRNNRKGKS